MCCGGVDDTSACRSRRLQKAYRLTIGRRNSPRDIDALLAQLRPQQREIVQSLSINGSSIRQTADRLKMTEGAVRVALHRALKALSIVYRSSIRED
jgi:DNA-directed RNA polymerase specialized sigma24 family protein